MPEASITDHGVYFSAPATVTVLTLKKMDRLRHSARATAATTNIRSSIRRKEMVWAGV